MESFFIRGRASLPEDALTAALGDLLTDLADPRLPLAIVSAFRTVDSEGHVAARALEAPFTCDAFEVELWPFWPGVGEPDMVIHFSYAGRPIAGVAVEVKYEARKSGEDLPEQDELRDQLGRYALGLNRTLVPEATRLVAYLTASVLPPKRELRDSWHAIRGKAALDPDTVLRWASWPAIDEILRSYAQTLEPSTLSYRRVARVVELLRKAGLRAFDGWSSSLAPPSLAGPPPALPQWLTATFRGWQIAAAPEPLPLPPQSSRHSPWNGWPIPSTETR